MVTAAKSVIVSDAATTIGGLMTKFGSKKKPKYIHDASSLYRMNEGDKGEYIHQSTLKW